jgi:Macro domain
MAFPAISTGIYGFPKQRAAKIAVTEVRRYTGGIERVVFACFDAETGDIYRGLLNDRAFVRHLAEVRHELGDSNDFFALWSNKCVCLQSRILKSQCSVDQPS